MAKQTVTTTTKKVTYNSKKNKRGNPYKCSECGKFKSKP